MLSPEQATHTTYQTHHTSAQALDAIGNAGKQRRDTEVHDIVIAAVRNGSPDISGREIQKVYEFLHSRRIETGTISGVISRLVAAKRIQHGPQRLCAVTGRNIVPVRPVAHQTRLVG